MAYSVASDQQRGIYQKSLCKALTGSALEEYTIQYGPIGQRVQRSVELLERSFAQALQTIGSIEAAIHRLY